MKKIFKISAGLMFTVFALSACDKKDAIAVYSAGTAPALTASATTSAPVDSTSAVTSLSWTSPNYDSYSDNNVLYLVQIDSAGKNFSNPQTIATFTGGLSRAIVAKDLNPTLLGTMGYAATVPVDLEMRILASKSNYDEQHASNTVKLHYTPYIPAMPQVQAIPVTTMPVVNELYMVGDMTPAGWTNAPPASGPSSQKLLKTGNIYSITLHVNGSGQYLLLPVYSSWNSKYAIQDGTSSAYQGYFGYNANGNFNSNFNSPSKPGTYLFRYDVSTGYYFVVRVG